MDLISVIIPVYNVEPYIRRCLDSVLNQTYKNLEILLIDDGSPDNSGKICDEYARKDNRIRVFHQKNGGLSVALSTGLNNSTGNYIGFIDSDDWVEPDMYEVLYCAAKSKNVPISVATYFTNTDTEETIVKNTDAIPDSVLSTEEMLVYSLKRDSYIGFCGYVWNKLYRADVVKSNKVDFYENIIYGNDALFFTEVTVRGKCNGVYTDKPLYHYYIRDTSMTNKDPLDNSKYIFKAYEKIIDQMNKHGYNDTSIWAKRFYCYFASMYAEIAIKNGNNKVLCEMQEKMKNYLSEYIKTNSEYPDRLERIEYLLGAKIAR